MTENKLREIKELVSKLNEARKAYEQEDREIMSNLEYDKFYDMLKKLEEETGVLLSNSPTINVGYEIQSSLPKEAHQTPMLSLDKTKDSENLKAWLGDNEGLLSWKLDGLTMVLTYEKGHLTKAVTRGNGQIGEVVTVNAKVFENLPLEISYYGNLTIRGEAIIPYSEFEKINGKIEDIAQKYKNPRNLCSGTVRQLNNEITAQRKVHFFAFALVEKKDDKTKAETEMSILTRELELEFLNLSGFATVEFVKVNSSTLEKEVNNFKRKVAKNDLPSDGLVLIYNDIKYGKSLGATSKFPKDSIAFKWEDEIAETVLNEIEWSASRTGLINPVAIFESVELEGTTVSRAGVHNLSILEDLELEVGDKIGIYKANMIIPQISENFSKANKKSWPGIDEIAPKKCPVCNGETLIKSDEGSSVKTLYCPNAQCLAKQIKSFTHFVSRDAINIEGLSEATIEKLISKNVVKELADIFHVASFRDIITEMEGFGEKSFQNLVKSVDKAKITTEVRLLFSLGISNIGLANAKNICRAYDFQWDKIMTANYEELIAIDGIGEVMAKGYAEFFADVGNKIIVEDILKEVEFAEVEKSDILQVLEGKNFVITGTLNLYENRKALQGSIEARGGKVTSSVTAKTDFLINNDNLSRSSKNKKAKELDIQIITEEEFNKLV